MEESYTFKVNKISWSKYIDNAELYYFNLKKKRLAYVYSPYKEIDGDGMKFQRTNENTSLIRYTIKLVDDSTYLTKTLEVVDAVLDNLAKIYNRKKLHFCNMEMTKPYFEKATKNGSTQHFHKFAFDEILYPDPTKLLPAFFHN